MAAAAGSSMSFGRVDAIRKIRLQDLPREPQSKMFTDSAWHGFIHSDARETCSGLHSTTVSRTSRVSVTKVSSRPSIAFV